MHESVSWRPEAPETVFRQVAGRLASADAPAWGGAVLNLRDDAFTLTGPGNVTFYDGSLNSSKAWRRGACKHGLFLAFAGDNASPADIQQAQERSAGSRSTLRRRFSSTA
ncbi:hypothetical protein ACSNOH_01595 [Streptomyces sp. URMC 127]|uniref:hypothetical protein n=1 Tax=Streptomyces sp. URMC 127 TaxID=3423402 RepID=UPI003F1C435C